MVDNTLHHFSISVFGKLGQSSFGLFQVLERAGYTVNLVETLDSLLECSNTIPPHLIIFDLQTNSREAKLFLSIANLFKYLAFTQVIFIDPRKLSLPQKLEVEGVGTINLVPGHFHMPQLLEEIRNVLKIRN